MKELVSLQISYFQNAHPFILVGKKERAVRRKTEACSCGPV